MKKTGLTILLALFAGFACSDATVTNLVVAQRPGTKLVDITYDVSSTVTNQVWVSLTASNGATAVNATNLTGAVGTVATGTGKSIVWNMATDWNGNVATGVVFTVVIGRPLGSDPSAIAWQEVNARWIKNTYANGDITMSDRDTGLMWLYNANPCGRPTWYNAMNYCDNLTYAGYSDWRLPDIDTLKAQYFEKSCFIGVQNDDFYYWSGTSNADGTDRAWGVNMGDGDVYGLFWRNLNYFYVWPVRGGQ